MHRLLFVFSFFAEQSEVEQLGEALESTTDAQEWRLEVERVLPALKIHIRHDNRVCSQTHKEFHSMSY